MTSLDELSDGHILNTTRETTMKSYKQYKQQQLDTLNRILAEQGGSTTTTKVFHLGTVTEYRNLDGEVFGNYIHDEVAK